MATHIVEKNNRSEMLLVIRFGGKLFLPDRFYQSVDSTEAAEGGDVRSSLDNWSITAYQVIRLSNLIEYSC
jgi:hypothetical protein